MIGIWRFRLVVVRFRALCVVSPPYHPLCFVGPLGLQNLPKGGDSAHFENHWYAWFSMYIDVVFNAYRFSVHILNYYAVGATSVPSWIISLLFTQQFPYTRWCLFPPLDLIFGIPPSKDHPAPTWGAHPSLGISVRIWRRWIWWSPSKCCDHLDNLFIHVFASDSWPISQETIE